MNKNVPTIKYDKKDGGKKCNEKCVHYCHDHDISGRSNAAFLNTYNLILLPKFLAYNITRKNIISYILSTIQSAKITPKGFKPGTHQYIMTARLINTIAVGQETTIKGMVGMKNSKMLARKHAMLVQVRKMT